MKKQVFLLIVSSLLSLQAVAQDTIISPLPADNLFYNRFPTSDTICLEWRMILPTDPYFDWPKERGKAMYTKDTLRVYGIAAAIMIPPVPPEFAYDEIYEDTTLDGCVESINMYKPDSNTLTQIGESLSIHLANTPVSYYWDIHKIAVPFYEMTPLLPIFERYFSTPIDVIDTFFITFTSNSYEYYDGESTRYPMGPAGINSYPDLYLGTIYADYYGGGRWVIYRSLYYDQMMYPILTPGKNAEDGDSVAVESVDMLERMVALSPNPATHTVKVISSFGLTRVEAYNTGGNLIYDSEATGLCAHLDISRWPAGAYVLRIHTPMGIVSRKLMVK